MGRLRGRHRPSCNDRSRPPRHRRQGRVHQRHDGTSTSRAFYPESRLLWRISPRLANVYLHRLDIEATKAGLRFVRYADDFIVTANRRWKARRADQMIRELVADIGLSFNEDKSGVRNLQRDEV
ncbi:MAG: reverse transcriptase domain-containing protein [Actinomycetota bacterium]